MVLTACLLALVCFVADDFMDDVAEAELEEESNEVPDEDTLNAFTSSSSSSSSSSLKEEKRQPWMRPLPKKLDSTKDNLGSRPLISFCCSSLFLFILGFFLSFPAILLPSARLLLVVSSR
jgi:hypothetical protein